MAAPKGHKPYEGGGRPKGSLNKVTADLKAMIRQALDEEGGVTYLRKQANENPTSFMTLIGKLIPIDVDVTKTQINVNVGLYPEEQDGGHKPIVTQEAAPGVH